MDTYSFDEIPVSLKEKITTWLTTPGALKVLIPHSEGTDDKEIDRLADRLTKGVDTQHLFSDLSDTQTQCIAAYLLAEAYNPRAYAHLNKNPERSFDYYASIANIVDAPEVWVRMGQMHWSNGNFRDAYYAFDAATEGQMKLTSGISVNTTAQHWLQNQAFLESAAAQERNDFRAAKMLERYIYRLDGSLRKSETFEEAEFHLKKIREGKTADRKLELQVFAGVELLNNNPNEQQIFIRDFEANLSSLEIAQELNGISKSNEMLFSSIKRDGEILKQLNLLGQCSSCHALIEKSTALINSLNETDSHVSINESPKPKVSYMKNH